MSASSRMPSLRRSRRGLTILEVLVSMAILLAGVVMIINFFPTSMKGAEHAELRQVGAFLAFMKMEEIRRDMDLNRDLLTAIEQLTEPTEPVTFAMEPRLAYSFVGMPILYRNFDATGAPVDLPLDPRDDPGVARILIQVSPEFRPLVGGRDVYLDEYRFRFR